MKAPTFSSMQEMISWVQSRTRAEEIESLIQTGEPRLWEVVCRHASPEVLSPELVDALLDVNLTWQPLPGVLHNLCANPRLSARVRERLFAWAQGALLALPERVQSMHMVRPNDRVAPLEMVRALETAGHATPATFWAPFRAEVRTFRGQKERKDRCAWYGTFLLSDWMGNGPRELRTLYRSVEEDVDSVAHLIAHPNASPELGLQALQKHKEQERIWRVLLAREETREDPAIRQYMVETGWARGAELFFPHATSEEFVSYVAEHGQYLAAQMRMLTVRKPTPEEMAAIVRRLGMRSPSGALWLLDEWKEKESFSTITADDLLPLLQSKKGEERIRAQSFWAWLESEGRCPTQTPSLYHGDWKRVSRS